MKYLLIFCLCLYLFGCGKKSRSDDETLSGAASQTTLEDGEDVSEHGLQPGAEVARARTQRDSLKSGGPTPLWVSAVSIGHVFGH